MPGGGDRNVAESANGLRQDIVDVLLKVFDLLVVEDQIAIEFRIPLGARFPFPLVRIRRRQRLR